MDLKGKIITQRPRKMKLEEEAHMNNQGHDQEQ